MTKKNKRIISVVLILFFITVIGCVIYCNMNPEKSVEEQLDEAITQSMLNDYADNCESYEESFAKAESDAKENNWSIYKTNFYKSINSPFKYIMFRLDKVGREGSVLKSFNYEKTANDEVLDLIFKDILSFRKKGLSRLKQSCQMAGNLTRGANQKIAVKILA